jgi:hypothetical protein
MSDINNKLFFKMKISRDFTDFVIVKNFKKYKIIKAFMPRDFTDFRIAKNINEKILLNNYS